MTRSPSPTPRQIKGLGLAPNLRVAGHLKPLRVFEGLPLKLHIPAPPTAGRQFGRAALVVLGLAVLGGCSATDLPVLHTAGPIALSERNLLFITFGLMMIVVIPVWVMAVWFPLKYRASNTDAEYEPHWDFSMPIEIAVWAVPALLVASIGALVWIYTYKLDPYAKLGPGQPLTVQAVSLDWKWVFIYPDQNIATVNELVVPVDQPITIDITSDTVMNSLYLPGLAGQIYAMAGMKTQMNFKADRVVQLTGLNTQYSGDLFPKQKFPVRAVSAGDFQAWVTKVKQSNQSLDQASYAALSGKRAAAPQMEFASAAPGLFDQIIKKYIGDGSGALLDQPVPLVQSGE